MDTDLDQRTSNQLFFVDRQHAHAADDNPGTEDRPFRTIQRAADLARHRGQEWPGDRIVVKAGVYREMVVLRHGGDEYCCIELVAAPGAEVWVKGSDIVRGWTRDSGPVWRQANWPVPSQQVFCDDRVLRQVADFSRKHYAAFVSFDGPDERPCAGRTTFANPHRHPGIPGNRKDMIPGSFYHDPESNILYVWLEDGSDPNDHAMEVSVRPHAFKGEGSSATGIRIAGFKVRHTSASVHGISVKGGMNGAIETGPAKWIIEDCDVQWTGFAGLLVMGRDHLVRGNVFNCNGNSGINVGTPHGPGPIPADTVVPPVEDVLLERNTTSANNYRCFSPGWWAGGMKIIPYCKRIRVIGHTAERNRGPGIWFDADCTDGEIAHCLCRDNDGHGIFYEISERAHIWNNLVLRNSGGLAIEGSMGCRVDHNLSAGNDYGLLLLRDQFPKWQARDNVIRNNIFANNLDFEVVAVAPSLRCARNTLDFNLYHRQAGPLRFEIHHEAAFCGLDAWRTRTGWDTHSILADPGWVAPERDDYHLRADSPALGAGVALESAAIDFDGRSRPLRSAIGPFEHEGPTGPTAAGTGPSSTGRPQRTNRCVPSRNATHPLKRKRVKP